MPAAHWREFAGSGLAFALLAGCTGAVPGGEPPAAAGVHGLPYHVDCAAPAAGDGSKLKPWRSLAAVNRQRFAPGDRLLFKRGTVCEGALNPQGSGAPGAPILIDSYGAGALPVIAAGGRQYAIKLSNQSFWEIRNIETTGGTRYGIFVTVEAGLSEHIRLANLVVHDVLGGEVDSKNTGLILISPSHDAENSTRARFRNVLVENVTAYNTNQWAGILVGSGTAADSWASNLQMRSSDVIVRNAKVHDTYGDGIVLFAVNRGLIEHSLAHRTGMQPVETIGTPNAIWTWSCMDCTVQHNEAYDNHSPGVDGGAYDIDWGNVNNIVQYNYGHHNSAYCIAIFGAGGLTTRNSIVRYNLCAHNGQAGRHQNKEIEITTWDGGTIDGLQIYNNSIHTSHGAFNSDFHSGGFAGDLPRFFKNNIVYMDRVRPGGPLAEEIDGLQRGSNLYYYPDPHWRSGEPGSLHADPRFQPFQGRPGDWPRQRFLLRRDSPAIDAGVDLCAAIPDCDMGGRDFFGATIPQGMGYDLGAHEVRLARPAAEAAPPF